MLAEGKHGGVVARIRRFANINSVFILMLSFSRNFSIISMSSSSVTPARLAFEEAVDFSSTIRCCCCCCWRLPVVFDVDADEDEDEAKVVGVTLFCTPEPDVEAPTASDGYVDNFLTCSIIVAVLSLTISSLELLPV